MSNSSSEYPPVETEPLFTGAIRGRAIVAAARFRCGACNRLVVDEPGGVCESCTAPADPSERVPARRTSSRRSRRTTTTRAKGDSP